MDAGSAAPRGTKWPAPFGALICMRYCFANSTAGAVEDSGAEPLLWPAPLLAPLFAFASMPSCCALADALDVGTAKHGAIGRSGAPGWLPRTRLGRLD